MLSAAVVYRPRVVCCCCLQTPCCRLLLSTDPVLPAAVVYRPRVAGCCCLQTPCCRLLLSTDPVLPDAVVYRPRVAGCCCLQTQCCRLLLPTDPVLPAAVVYRPRVAGCCCLQTPCCRLLLSTDPVLPAAVVYRPRVAGCCCLQTPCCRLLQSPCESSPFPSSQNKLNSSIEMDFFVTVITYWVHFYVDQFSTASNGPGSIFNVVYGPRSILHGGKCTGGGGGPFTISRRLRQSCGARSAATILRSAVVLAYCCGSRDRLSSQQGCLSLVGSCQVNRRRGHSTVITFRYAYALVVVVSLIVDIAGNLDEIISLLQHIS